MNRLLKVGRDYKVCDKLLSVAKNQLHAVWLFTYIVMELCLLQSRNLVFTFLQPGQLK